jgi:hypothetical protein
MPRRHYLGGYGGANLFNQLAAQVVSSIVCVLRCRGIHHSVITGTGSKYEAGDPNHERGKNAITNAHEVLHK